MFNGFSSTGGARSLILVPFVLAVTAVFSTSRQGSSRPRKSLGQHFLADGRIVGRILDAARLEPEDVVVEIGPGRGVLTRRLVSRAARVVAVELDSALAGELPGRLGWPENLTVVNEDARTLDLASFRSMGGSYKVVANLPYYAANPITRLFLESDFFPALMVIMVQKEVADSMTAGPGKMSLLSVATQFYSAAKQVCTVPAAAFRPAPKVNSAVVRLERHPALPLDKGLAESFFSLARAGFSAPRKQLRNSLCQGLGQDAATVSGLLERAGVDATRRAETLTMEEWLAIFHAYRLVQSDPSDAGVPAC